MPYRGQTPRNCHTCKKPMSLLTKDTANVDHCGSCKHTFFDAGELAQLTPDGAALEAKIADYSNPQLHCDDCQRSILEDYDCTKPVARCCPGCGAALFIAYALPFDLEFCRACKGIVVQDEMLQKAREQKLELSRVQVFSEEEMKERQGNKPQHQAAMTAAGFTAGAAFELILALILS